MNTSTLLATIACGGLAYTGTQLGTQLGAQEAGPSETTPIVEVVAPPAPAPRRIDLAICLDTSGSMSGLIDAARQKIWSIVNDLALAQPQPELRVALLTFGNDGHNAENGWVEVQTGLTGDLDLVSQRLFELSTNGGNEYVGRVVDRATRQLAWTDDAQALKLIVVAGNESAFQDPEVEALAASRHAIAQGIMVNAIYCGAEGHGDAASWEDVSRLADGHFATIDQQNGTLVVTTPFDQELAELSAALNTTYVPYGAAGSNAWNNQSAQDENASKLNSAAAADRATNKASALYKCTSWDLVDACREGTVELEKIAKEDLPEEMRSMTIDEQRVHVAAMADKRAKIQQKVEQLTAQRREHVAEQMRQNSLDASKSLDRVLQLQIRDQATAKGYAFPQVEQPAPQAGAAGTDSNGGEAHTEETQQAAKGAESPATGTNVSSTAGGGAE